MPTVSIIIPVHNSQKHLRQCLDSVANQTEKDLQVICIDTGSTDESAQILQSYSQNDARFEIHEIGTAGPGKARNAGFGHATGDFVIFWDSDDFFEENALELMLGKMEEDGADICLCDAQDFDDETGESIPHGYLRKPLPDSLPFNIHEYSERFFSLTSPVGWNKLIRRSLLEDTGFSFPETSRFEDVAPFYLAMAQAKGITLVNKKLVHYRTHQTTNLMSAPSADYTEAFHAYASLGETLDSLGLTRDERIKRSFVNRAVSIYLWCLSQIGTYEDYETFYRELKEEILPGMGADNLPEGYLLSENDELRYRSLLNGDASSYLLDQYKLHLQQIEELKARNAKLAARNKELERFRENTLKIPGFKAALAVKNGIRKRS